jgi:hypothetical protein
VSVSYFDVIAEDVETARAVRPSGDALLGAGGSIVPAASVLCSVSGDFLYYPSPKQVAPKLHRSRRLAGVQFRRRGNSVNPAPAIFAVRSH